MTETAATPAPQPEEKPTPKSTTKSHRFVRWLRKHHRLLTFVGALIVFGTFVVKDALREQLKDLVDSIDSAQSTYVVRMDISRIELYVKSLNRYVRYGSSSQGETKIAQTESLKRDIDDLVGMTQYLAAQVGNINRLAQKLGSANKKEVTNSIESINKQHEDLRASVTDYVRLAENNDQSRLSEMSSKIDASWHTAETLVTSTPQFAFNLLTSAREVSKRQEERYRFYTWASYFLYALGWSLGLIGRLVGVETGAGE